MKIGSRLTEGGVFAVPLVSGFAFGILVRSDGRGRAYGVFYGPRVNAKEDLEISRLKKENEVLRCRFGDNGLHSGRWSMVGKLPSWNRMQWPIPKFWRRHDKDDFCYITEYDDDLNVLSELIAPKEDSMSLPYDAQYGAAIVESKLEKLL